LVLFIDDDCVCSPELVASHYNAHSNGSQLLVMGVVVGHPDSPAGSPSELQRELEDAEFHRLTTEGVKRTDMMLCANTSVHRQAALRFCFDTTYKRIHDVEAGARLWKAGYRPKFAPNAVCHELFSKTAEAMLRDSENLGKYEVLLTNSHPEFKPFSAIASMNRGNPLMRFLRKQLAIHRNASEFLLRPVFLTAELLRHIPLFSSLAKRILKVRAVIAHLSGAIQQAGSWKCLNESFGKLIPAILYHNVGEPRPNEYPGLTTPIAEFEMQIRFLSKMGYTGIRPTDWLRWRDAGGMLPERPVLLVFDDGYADLCRNAFPILQRYGFEAASMLVTRHIGSTNRWDEEAGRPSFQLMSADEIKDWSTKNIEFGGHTSSHPELPLVSRECMEQEISQCKDDLTALLGSAPVAFAYPFGGVNSAAQDAARKHFELAFTVWPGLLHLGTDPHLLPRITFLPGETRFGMWCRLRLGKNPFEVCRNRWRLLLRLVPTE
jgi:peptidoglycan/xylan/chitin deacetylase (PgdA/CDA1 family)